MTSGEQARGNSAMNSTRLAHRDQMCQWCGKFFVHVKKHDRFCKMRPQTQSPGATPKEPATGAGTRKSEQKPCQDANHSANEVDAGSLHFQHIDIPAPDYKIERKKKLKLPAAKDVGCWRTIDEDLSQICSQITEKDPEERLEKVESLTYAYLETRYAADNKVPSKVTDREGGETKAIRISKRNVSKDFRNAKAAGAVTRQQSLKQEYLRLVRLHNKSRRMELRKKKRKDVAKEQRSFRKNPYEYGKKLLNEANQGEPDFSREDAEKFFKKEYSHRQRGDVFDKLEGLPLAEKPSKEFQMEVLGWEDFEKKLKSRRNKSSPGPNGVPYTVYKRCSRLRRVIFDILSLLWIDKKVPRDWKIGESVLIAKTEELSDPAKFRNITKSNTSGKLNMGILADRMMDHMVENNYIDRSVQKGFLRKTPGCVEHTQALMEELHDAKSSRRQIYVVWVDLMNAYGRVPHNLILFALRHYHFPEWLVEYLYRYYDELVVRVTTRKWTTDWFFYLIGLFQGDPLSVILFLIVFNLLLDFLKNRRSLGYVPTFTMEETGSRAFADDLTLLSCRLEKVKEQLRLLEEFLDWTGMMRAKPSKCVALGMKVVDGRYVSFDPDLEIGGEKLAYLGGKPIKFLGHWIYINLDDSETRRMIEAKLIGLLDKVDDSVINGIMKCWIYNHLGTNKVAGDLMIYNLPISFVKHLATVF